MQGTDMKETILELTLVGMAGACMAGVVLELVFIYGNKL